MAGIVEGVQGWLEHASLRLKILVALGLVVGGLAIGYVAGIANKADVGAARAAGERAGQAQAGERGSQQGYAAGLATGTREGNAQTYRSAYRDAYDKALAGTGGG